MRKALKYVLIMFAAYMLPVIYGFVIRTIGVDVKEHWAPVVAGYIVLLAIAAVVHWKCLVAVQKHDYERQRRIEETLRYNHETHTRMG